MNWEFTAPAFKRWLLNQPRLTDLFAIAGDPECCPLAIFVTEMTGFPSAVTRDYYWSIDRHPMPDWAKRFMDRLNRRHRGQPVTVNDVLALLN